MGLPAIGTVDREAIATQGLAHIGVRDQPRAVLREDVLFHSEEQSSRNVELTGERPKGKNRPDGLHAAVRVFQPGVHDGAGSPCRGDPPRQLANFPCRDPRYDLRHLRPEVLHIAAQIVKPHRPLQGKMLVV